jgi:hypothetical protein
MIIILGLFLLSRYPLAGDKLADAKKQVKVLDKDLRKKQN